MKVQVLQAIGEAGFDSPAKIDAALEANDRVKYYLSLVQMAAAHARDPNGNASTLQRERIAAGVDDPTHARSSELLSDKTKISRFWRQVLSPGAAGDRVNPVAGAH